MAELVTARQEGRVGIVAIDRPERRNALNLQVKQEIVDRVESFARDESVAVIVLTGEGGFFVAGTDIAEMAQMSPTDHVRLETDRVFHVRSPVPEAGHRGRGGVCARRRLRAGAGLRHDRRGRRCAVRPAGDPRGHHARRGRHAAAAAHGGALQDAAVVPDGRR